MTNKNYEHLIRLYDRAYKICEQIKAVIEEDKIEELDDLLRIKGEVFKSILHYEKIIKITPDEESKRLEYRNKIEEFEKSNIELLKDKQQEVKKELQKVAKGKKITRAYLSHPPEINSTIDIRE